MSSNVAAIFAKVAENLGVDSSDLEVLAADGIVAAGDLYFHPPSAERFAGFLAAPSQGPPGPSDGAA